MANLQPINYLKPFTKFCCSIGALPTSYMESLTYEEQLLWLCNYLENTVIPTVNQNGEAVTELQNLYIQLKSYVDNYFTNLDVQEEINNKLDEMATSGELEIIIDNFLKINSLIVCDTFNDMINNNIILNGSTVKTLGYYSKNDRGGAYYKIRNKVSSDVNDNAFIVFLTNPLLVAELIIDNNFFLEQIGAKANESTFDNKPIYDKAINSNKISTINFNKGNYYFSTLSLNYAINIKGQGAHATGLCAMLSTNAHFITLEKGPIAECVFEGFQLIGNPNNNNQDGLYIYGLPQDETPKHGGCWYCRFNDIIVNGFTNRQILLQGVDPTSSFLVVNQFLTFNNIKAYGNSNAGNVLEILSQNGQLQFNNCEFTDASTNAYNIYCTGDVLFNLLTCQGGTNGIYCSGSCLTLIHPWFESISGCILNCDDAGTTYGSNVLIENGTIRNCTTNTNATVFKVTARTILHVDTTKFMISATPTIVNVPQTSSNNLEFTNNYFAGDNTLFSSPDCYPSINESNMKIISNRISLISTDNTITSITLGEWVRNAKSIPCQTLKAVTFSGSKFVNPQTIPAFKLFNLIPVFYNSSTSNLFYIQYT